MTSTLIFVTSVFDCFSRAKTGVPHKASRLMRGVGDGTSVEWRDSAPAEKGVIPKPVRAHCASLNTSGNCVEAKVGCHVHEFTAG
eukprot:1191934-Prorocentrum_minimum.AAC.2